MAQDVNTVTLVCRLAAEPVLRDAGSSKVAALRIAFNTSRPDGDGGWEDKGNFMNAAVFGRSAEAVVEYVRKGDRIAITGRLEMNEWTDKEGRNRQDIQIIANQIGGVQFLEPRNQDGDRGGGQQKPAAGGSSWGNAPGRTQAPDDDDIPF